MKTSTTIAITVLSIALVGAASTTAMATEYMPDSAAPLPFTASKTRAEVRAEMLAARADGTLAAANAEGGAPLFAAAPRGAVATLASTAPRMAGRVRFTDYERLLMGEGSGFSQVPPALQGDSVVAGHRAAR